MEDCMQHNQRTSYFRLITVLLAAALVVGCGRGFIPEPSYQATALPDDVTELFKLSGNLASDTVWVFAQGGPLHMLDPYTSQYFSNYRSYEDVQFAHAHQTLTLNHDLAPRHAEFSLAELQAEVDVSVEILHRTIEHFRDQGKRVVVIGHSYGAFLMARYLSHHGPGAADRYLIMAGRLDMPADVVTGFLMGMPYWFPDGEMPEPVPRLPVPVPVTDQQLMEMRIAGATGHDRYTERLADTDLQKVIYVYGTLDEAVGRLTEDEVGFLSSRGATIIALQDGRHDSMFGVDAAQQISDALQE
jgi:hypothetical protein